VVCGKLISHVSKHASTVHGEMAAPCGRSLSREQVRFWPSKSRVQPARTGGGEGGTEGEKKYGPSRAASVKTISVHTLSHKASQVLEAAGGASEF
jgi:hypothetical protein